MADNRLSILATLNTEGFKKGINEMKRGMQRFKTSDLTSMSRSLAVTSAAFTAMGVAAVKAAADVEALQTSLISLTGGTQQAADTMQKLNEFTAKTPFQLEGVVKAFRQLVASGTAPEEATRQLQFLGDIAATTGSNIDEISAIFSKVKAKGKVELKALNQLAERGIPIFKTLAESTGLPADALGAGAVSVQQFEDALKSMADTGGFAEGAMQRLSETTTGKFSTAMDNVKLAAAEVGKALKPLADAILDATIAIAQFLQNNPLLAKALGLFLAIGAAVTAAAAAVLAFEAAATAGLIATMTSLAAPIAGIITGLTALATLISVVKEKQEKARLVTDSAASAQRAYNDAVADFKKSSEANLNSIDDLIERYGLYAATSKEAASILGELKDRGIEVKDLNEDGKISQDELTAAVKAYREELLETARAEGTRASKGSLTKSLELQKQAVEDKLREIKDSGVFEKYGLNFDDFFNYETKEFDLTKLQEEIKRQVKAGGDTSIISDLGDFIRFDLQGPQTGLNTLITLLQGTQEELEKVENRLDDLNGVTFDPETYNKGFREITEAHAESVEEINRKEAEGVIDTEEANKRKKKAYDDYLKTLETEYDKTYTEIQALQNQDELSDDDRRRLNFLTKDYLPGLKSEFALTYDAIREIVKKSGESEEEAAKKRIENYEKELQRLNDIENRHKKRAKAEEVVNKYLGLREDGQATEAGLSASYKKAIDLQTERLLLEESLTTAKEEEKAAIEALIAKNIELRNEELTRYSILSSQLAAQKALASIDSLGLSTGSADNLLTSLTAVTQEMGRLATRRSELEGFLKDDDPSNDANIAQDLIGIDEVMEDLDEVITEAARKAKQVLESELDFSDIEFNLANGFITEATALDQKATRIIKDFQDKAALSAFLATSGYRELAEVVEGDTIQSFDDLIAVVGESDKALAQALRNMRDKMAGATDATKDFSQVWKDLVKDGTFQLVQQALSTMFNAITDGLKDVLNGTASLGNALKSILFTIIDNLLSVIQAVAIEIAVLGAKAAVTASGGTAAPLAPAIIAGLVATTTAAAKAFIPAFAEGGAVFGPTLALVGEKPGSRGEAIVPFEKIGQFVDQVGGGGGPTDVTVYGVVKGRDIELTNRRGGKQRTRRH